jgi:hypothetical protein
VARAVGGNLFKDKGVIPARSDLCKNCKEASDDLFKCDRNTKHLKCTNCQLLFPERPMFNQQCFSCDRYFCNLYWKCGENNAVVNPVREIIWLKSLYIVTKIWGSQSWFEF